MHTLAPSDIFASFGPAVLTVTGWVAAGIAAGVVFYFAFIGVRKGLNWAFQLIGEATGRWDAQDAGDAAYQAEAHTAARMGVWAGFASDHIESGGSGGTDSVRYADKEYFQKFGEDRNF